MISNKCYTCIGVDQGVDNVKQCSLEDGLPVSYCPSEDLFDWCLVFQAFSKRLNTTIFRRECVSERFCSADMLCADQDFVDCNYECCEGDLCNDFYLKKESTTVEPDNIQLNGKKTTESSALVGDTAGKVNRTEGERVDHRWISGVIDG